MTKEIFLSYGRKEAEVVAFAERLKGDLEKSGLSVWLDRSDIPAGSGWHGDVGTALANCKALIAVITKDYLASNYCTNELFTADSNQKLIFPIIHADVDFSTSAKARGVQFVVGSRNWTFFRPGYDDYIASFQKLVHGLKEQGLGVGGSDSADGLVEQVSQLHLSPGAPAGGTFPPPPPSTSPSAPPFSAAYAPPMATPTTPQQQQQQLQQHQSPYRSPVPQQPYPQPHNYMYYASPPQPPLLPPPPQFNSPGAPPIQQGQQQGHPAAYDNNPYPPPPTYSDLYLQGAPGHQEPRLPYPGAAQGTTSPYNPYYHHHHPHSAAYPPPPPPPQPQPQVSPMLQPSVGMGGGPPHPPTTQLWPHPPTPETVVHVPGPPMGGPGGVYMPPTEPHPPPQYSPYIEQKRRPSSEQTEVKEPLPQAPPTTPPTSSSSLQFQVGTKLEAVDKRFPYFVCVATVMNRKDDLVLIHFDGWGPEYDYWCAPDCVELHPAGWCEQHRWELQTPLNQEWSGWKTYLDSLDAEAAGEQMFTKGQLAGPGSQLFSSGMKVEARDRLNPGLTCVATISEIKDGQLLIHFDGWSTRYDYWCKPSSTDIHPPMWCQKNHQKVTPPPKGSDEGNFTWNRYLAQPENTPAPAHLFAEDQLSGSGDAAFRLGMKLEAKDRKHPGLTCVATVSEIRDGQLLIHFDGWSTTYDYWCEPSSTDIHPVGWCLAFGKKLQPPKGHVGAFKWSAYLSQPGNIRAPDKLFTKEQRNSASSGFRPGMKLEAKDRQYPDLTCVATISEIRDGQLLIHFDGWSTSYDYWCEPSSTDIHPVGWCQANGRKLQPPKGYFGVFKWSVYLSQRGNTCAPDNLFTKEQKGGCSSSLEFRPGMKLEAKDRKNPGLTCVATISEIRDGQLLIHFDGWSTSYDYWCEPSSTDIHPVGWCLANGKELQPPYDYDDEFFWEEYLLETGSCAAPEQAFDV